MSGTHAGFGVMLPAREGRQPQTGMRSAPQDRLNPPEEAGYNVYMGVEVVPKLTFDRFRQLPDDGKRYELVRGEVHLTPSPTTKHQFVLHRLVSSLDLFCRKITWARSCLPRSMSA